METKSGYMKTRSGLCGNKGWVRGNMERVYRTKELMQQRVNMMNKEVLAKPGNKL